MRENLGVYGCNSLSYSETFSVILTAHGFLPNLGFPRISYVVIVYSLSSIFLLIDVIIAMSYGRILGTTFPRSSVLEDCPQQLVSGIKALWFGDGDNKSLREIV